MPGPKEIPGNEYIRTKVCLVYFSSRSCCCVFVCLFFSQILAKLYDEIVQRKQSALDVSEMNDKNFRQALELILEVCFCFFQDDDD